MLDILLAALLTLLNPHHFLFLALGVMLGMAVGSMVGTLARRAFGVYDLPIPRATPAGSSDPVMGLPTTR